MQMHPHVFTPEQETWLKLRLKSYPQGDGKGMKAKKSVYKERTIDDFFGEFPMQRLRKPDDETVFEETEAQYNDRRIEKKKVGFL